MNAKDSSIVTALGMFCGSVLVAAFAVMVLIPQWMSYRYRNSYHEARSIVETIRMAQLIYLERSPKQVYGTLLELKESGFLERVEIDANNEASGYRFEIGLGLDRRYEYWLKASPIEPGVTGDIFFYSNQGGIIQHSSTDFRVNQLTGDYGPGFTLIPTR